MDKGRPTYSKRKNREDGDMVAYEYYHYQPCRKGSEGRAKPSFATVFMKEMEKIYNANNLFEAFRKAKQGTDWKESVQQYEANLLVNLLNTQKSLMDGSYKPKAMTEFKLCERGHTRQIKAQHIYDRVVQRSLNDNVLIPAVRPRLIYDNGASLENKGLDFARKRFQTHLRKAYRDYGMNGYVLLMDFTKYYDNVRHDVALDMYKPLLSDEVNQFMRTVFDEFKIDVSYMTNQQYSECMDKVFDALKYAEIPDNLKTGKRYMKKSLGIGNQTAQITGVFYPHKIDNYCKIVRGIKYYGRYMDDTYIIMQDKAELQRVYDDIKTKCRELGIFINQKKTHIYKISCQLTWLKINHKLLSTGRIIRTVHSSTIARERRRLRKFYKNMADGRMTFADIKQCYDSWRGSYRKYDSKSKLHKLDKFFNELIKEEMKNGK